jgi:branched-chain amino acid transport system substrate-binding protein
MRTLARRRFLGTCAAGLAACAPLAMGQRAKLRVGILFPHGSALANGFRLHLAERGGRLGGREVELLAAESGEKPDVVVGTSPSRSGLLSFVADRDGTAPARACAPNVFRSDGTAWQAIHALGGVMRSRGHRTAAWIGSTSAAGRESYESFKDGFARAGGKVTAQLWVPAPETEFRPQLAEIRGARPDAVACAFEGEGAIAFVHAYAAEGLKAKLPLYGGGFLTEGTLRVLGAAAQGILTTLHYADSLEFPKDREFRLRYAKTYKLQPDIHAVHGYDAAQMLGIGLEASKGDPRALKTIAAALERATIDSPRGRFTLSKAHVPVMDIYLRQVVGEQNRLVGIAWKSLADPGRECGEGVRQAG